MDALDLKHSKSLLIELRRIGTAKKTDLFSIVKSHHILDKVLKALEDGGFLTVEVRKLGPPVYTIALTNKGKAVAEQLKRAEEISQGKSFTFPDKFAIISYLSDSGPVTLSQLKERYPDALDIIREFESMKVIRQEIDNSKHPPINRIALTEKGMKIADYLRKIEEILKR